MHNDKLLQKYNIPVPRYTSYPPANFFTEDYTAADFQQAIDESNSWKPENISFYFHVPFCKKLCYFCGCNSYVMRSDDVVDAYMKAMISELKMVIAKLDKSRKVSQIHYGGGTPNAVDIEYLKEINQLIFDNFQTIEQPEIAIECNPAYLSEKQIVEFKDAGFKRFSLGIQDFDLKVLNAINRDAPFTNVAQIIEQLKANDPDIAVNLDFIYGLPYQNEKQFTETIEKAVALRPNRLVTFGYAHVPWVSKIQKKLEVHGLPDNAERVKMNAVANRIMLENGYHAIGMDHYALENDELFTTQNSHALNRNFQGYCTKRTTGQVYACGVTGISQLGKVYAQNTKLIEDYIALISNNEFPTIKGYRLTDAQVKTREVITALMCNYQVDFNELEQNDNAGIEYFLENDISLENELSELENDGLILFKNNILKVREEGKIFVRNVASIFDSLYESGGNRYSKPV